MRFDAQQLAPLLQQGLQDLGLRLDPSQQQQLLDYLALLHQWGQVYNLTAVRDPQDMLRLHLLDCLAVVQPFQRAQVQLQAQGLGVQVLDVGAGAGLPSVVLAVCCPTLAIDCVDAVAKKMAFVRQVASALRLGYLQAVHARVQALTSRYSIITSRAFASLSDFTCLTAPLLSPGGVWMAMKGKHPEDEIADLPDGVEVFHVEPLQVPGLDAQRCIVWMRQRVV